MLTIMRGIALAFHAVCYFIGEREVRKYQSSLDEDRQIDSTSWASGTHSGCFAQRDYRRYPVKTTVNGAEPKRAPRLPPRWFFRSFWALHRATYSVTGGRFGLRTATADRWGMMRLRTVGRRTGTERTAILGYFEDGPNLVTMAMNGWADAEPAWWLNLQASPDTSVDLPDGSRAVHARAADEDERPRLWAKWALYDKDLDAFAARRSRETQVVILEPLTAPRTGSGRTP